MSVLIKDMQMPSGCRECRLMDYDLHTGITWCFPADAILAEDYKSIDFDGRPDWCPMGELPEKHGRLVDADKIKATYGEWYTEEGSEEGFIGTVGNLIDLIPTVIEAEGAES